MNNYKYYGPSELPSSIKVAILNSRQSKYPVGNDSWVKNCVKASEHIARKGYTLIASLGMNSWELSLALAAIKKIPVIIILWYQPDDIDQFRSEVCQKFDLDAGRVGIIAPEFDSLPSDRSRWPDRDRLALKFADLVLPVSIRAGGIMTRLIDSYNTRVDRSFQTKYDKSRRKRPVYEVTRINPELASGRWLIHFTRTNSSHWPGQSETEYYRSVIDSGDNYCHSALDALNNISSHSLLRGSGSNLKKGNKAIGFTDCEKIDLGKFFRYRPRLVNPGFEPYGIAIEKEFAISIGIRPVIYGDEKLYQMLKDNDRPYYQNVGKNGRFWESESEWRLTGDLRLDQVPDGSLAQVVPDRSEIGAIVAQRSMPVLPLVAE